MAQVNFPMQRPWGEKMAAAFQGLAESINDEPGFIWKVWIEDEAAGRSGGNYLFDSRDHAEAYVAMHTERLAGFGISDVSATYSNVNEELSRLNGAHLN